MTAYEALANALAEALSARLRVPCIKSEQWTSEDPHERVQAALACDGCPMLTLCAAAADENGEVWGVWGGVDRGRTAHAGPIRRIRRAA